MRSLKNLVILQRLVEQFRLTWQLMRDPRTPAWLKWSSHRRVALCCLTTRFRAGFHPDPGTIGRFRRDIGVDEADRATFAC